MYVEVGSEPPQPTIASLAAARSVTPDTLLRTAALGLHHTPMVAPHLKFGMLVSFALATVFLAGAKYYFDRQVSVVLRDRFYVTKVLMCNLFRTKLRLQISLFFLRRIDSSICNPRFTDCF